jgi:hypothetical protein
MVNILFLIKVIFRFKDIVIITSLTGAILINTLNIRAYDIIDISNVLRNDFTYSTEYLESKIFDSIHLSDEEKEYLFNKDFLKVLLKLLII